MEYNPYAAPSADTNFRPASGDAIAYRAHNGALKWVYLGMLLGGFLFIFVGMATRGDAGSMLVGLGAIAAFFGRLIVALFWIHAAWSAIPPDHRVTDKGRYVSPGQAVGNLFIP